MQFAVGSDLVINPRVLAIALAFFAAGLNWPVLAAYEGQWSGKIVSDYGISCKKDLEMNITIRSGTFSGVVVGGDSRFTVSGEVAQNGHLNGASADGEFVFNLSGKATGPAEIGGYWTAWEGDIGVCAGSFRLGQLDTTKVSAQAVEPPTSPVNAPIQEPQPNESGQSSSDTARTWVSPPAPTATRSVATSESGAFFVQLASYKSKNVAKQQWADLLRTHPVLLREKQLNIQSVDLVERGIFYRVRAGPYSDRTTAQQVCLRFKARNQACLVSK